MLKLYEKKIRLKNNVNFNYFFTIIYYTSLDKYKFCKLKEDDFQQLIYLRAVVGVRILRFPMYVILIRVAYR